MNADIAAVCLEKMFETSIQNMRVEWKIEMEIMLLFCLDLSSVRQCERVCWKERVRRKSS